MRNCIKCLADKPISEFHKRSGSSLYRKECKKCFNKACGDRVTRWRQRAKEKLVAHFGSSCIDCGYSGPPFMFDFDHKDPSLKSFGIASGGDVRSYDKLLSEAKKCDLVCANCHRFRTHTQRCSGCKYCNNGGLTQSGRVPFLQNGSRGFKSLSPYEDEL